MTKFFQGLSLAFLLLAASIAPAAAQNDPAAATVQGFYDALVASMKAGGPAKSRYEKLKPGVDQAFDLAAMTALSVGPTWSSIPDADQKALTEAFGRFTIANYVRNFDSYNGEKFTVDPAVAQRGTDKYVKSTLKPGSGDVVVLNYRLHQVGSDWKIVDVYLAGNISTLAQKRADFASTLASGGPQALTKRINALADQMLGERRPAEVGQIDPVDRIEAADAVSLGERPGLSGRNAASSSAVTILYDTISASLRPLLMSSYEPVDPEIRAWAETHASPMFKSFAGREARFCYFSSSKGECFQISIEPPEDCLVKVHVWTVETLDDREVERHWEVAVSDLKDTLDIALDTVRGWLAVS